MRRTANEINRRFVCACGKAYGSEGSLNQHKKNKGHYTSADQLSIAEAANAVGMPLPLNSSSSAAEMLMAPGLMAGGVFDENSPNIANLVGGYEQS